MTIHAALMTGRGTGAISTIEVFGDSAQTVIGEIFRPAGTKTTILEMGRILLGTIADGTKVIDQVTLGCEGPESFAIHCHGNPLIVEMIMDLLRKHGAHLITAEQLLAETLAAEGRFNTIAIEAKLAQAKAKTIDGAKILANQVKGGLTGTAKTWLGGMEQVFLDKIKADAAEVLHNSQAAGLIIYGCMVVLTGPPNSGKSTLLNYLAGRQKAIVTEIRGTTRDWVEAECRIGPLSVTLIDTAGVDEEPAQSYDTIEQAARNKTSELLKNADLVLLVLDRSQSALELDSEFLDSISKKQIITVLNKSDLPASLDANLLPQFSSEPVHISAKEGKGTATLTKRMRQISGTEKFDLLQPVCFTRRQEELLGRLTNCESKTRTASIITELLNGQT